MYTSKRKKIVLLGGLGVIGSILTSALSEKYHIVVVDFSEKPVDIECDYIQIDVTDYNQLIERLPRDLEILVDLIGLPEKETIVDNIEFQSMVNTYIIGTYNAFVSAKDLCIHKVIYASSNRVTGHYEKDGVSILGREITTLDYPLAGNVYGAMKLFGEQIGRLFSYNFGISVICLRIGTVVSNEFEFVCENERAKHTILSHQDTVNIFTSAIESEVDFGIYYGVSDNIGKPWSIKEAMKEINYNPSVNAEIILKDLKKR